MKRIIVGAILCLFVFCEQAFPLDTLRKVVIFTRHGVRSPTWTQEKLNAYSTSPWPDFGVPPGYLTPHGYQLMRLMGAYYRESLTSLGLSPACDTIYFWADTDQRTIETGKALAETMVSGCKAEVFSSKDKSDPLFDPIEAGFAKPDPELALAAVQGRLGPNSDGLMDAFRTQLKRFQSILAGSGKPQKTLFDSPITLAAGKDNVEMSGPLATASTLTEVLLLEYANGFDGDKFAWGRLNPEDLDEMIELHTGYAELMRRTPYLAQARGSNLLDHILHTLQQGTRRKAVKGAVGPANAKIVIIVGHDTNISNLSALLDLSWAVKGHAVNDSTPGGALVFSLWRSAEGKDMVRIQFITQTLEQMHDATPLSLADPPAVADLFIPGCSTKLSGYPCELKAFETKIKGAINPDFLEK